MPLITRLSVSLCLKNPDAGRVAPISACVLCLRLVVAFFQTSLMRHPISICAIQWRRKVTKSGQKKDRINAPDFITFLRHYIVRIGNQRVM